MPPSVNEVTHVEIERLTVANVARARTLFATMSRVFELDPEDLSEAYLSDLLSRDEFWAFEASIEGAIVGGLTAHTLPLTRAEEREVFIYDLAVVAAYQRQGIGRKLLAAVRSQAASRGISVVFVPADNEDTHALDFYRSVGGAPAAVTIFTFSDGDE